MLIPNILQALRLGALMFCLLLLAVLPAHAQYFKTQNASIAFTSDAPLETISARSNLTAAVVSPSSRVFAFSVQISTFNGFNSALQKQHFNESYMESGRYAYGTFKGKIIESVDLNRNGTYQVRAKGVFEIHGVKKERIIPATVVVNGNQMTIQAQFDVPLSDHNIRIPKIVFQKIAEVIRIQINATLIKG